MSRSELFQAFQESEDIQAVFELCQRLGPAFVIDTARKYTVAKERAAAEEHKRWREEMVRITQETPDEHR